MNHADDSGKTAIHKASYKGKCFWVQKNRTQFLRFLFEFTGNEKVIKLLIDNGAYINAVDADQSTALHYNAKSGNKLNLLCY